MRKLVAIAAVVDLPHFGLFMTLGSPELAWPKVSSIALHAMVYQLLRWRANTAAMVLEWVEVVVHAAAGTLSIGWDSGFHDNLLLFAPAIVVGSGRRRAALQVALMFVCCLGLDVASYGIGPTTRIPGTTLALVRWINLAIVLSMFWYGTACCRAGLQRVGERIRLSATREPLTGVANHHHSIARAERELASQRRMLAPMARCVTSIDGLPFLDGTGRSAAAKALLAHLGRTLRRRCRLEDTVGHWAGNEFVALLPRAAWQEALAFAERIRQAQASSTGEPPASAQVCIGVGSVLPGEMLGDAPSRARHALRQCQLLGGDRIGGEASAPPGRPTSDQPPHDARHGRVERPEWLSTGGVALPA